MWIWARGAIMLKSFLLFLPVKKTGLGIFWEELTGWLFLDRDLCSSIWNKNPWSLLLRQAKILDVSIMTSPWRTLCLESRRAHSSFVKWTPTSSWRKKEQFLINKQAGSQLLSPQNSPKQRCIMELMPTLWGIMYENRTSSKRLTDNSLINCSGIFYHIYWFCRKTNANSDIITLDCLADPASNISLWFQSF